MEHSIWIYLLIINVITFLLFGVDKRKAVHGKWRIQERTLLSCALLGGAAGGLLGMLLFRHKTRKAIFQIGIPIILLCHIGLALYLSNH